MLYSLAITNSDDIETDNATLAETYMTKKQVLPFQNGEPVARRTMVKINTQRYIGFFYILFQCFS